MDKLKSAFGDIDELSDHFKGVLPSGFNFTIARLILVAQASISTMPPLRHIT